MFGDPDVFAEFEKPREPSDRLLLETFKEKDRDSGSCELKATVNAGHEETSGNDGHATFTLGSGDDSGSDSDGSPENSDIYDKDNVTRIKEQPVCEKQGVTEMSTSLSDNRGSQTTVKALEREIDKLKKESILCNKVRKSLVSRMSESLMCQERTWSWTGTVEKEFMKFSDFLLPPPHFVLLSF